MDEIALAVEFVDITIAAKVAYLLGNCIRPKFEPSCSFVQKVVESLSELVKEPT